MDTGIQRQPKQARKQADVSHLQPSGLSIRARIWIEREGQALLSQGRARLLAQIALTGSINGAAHALGMSFRHAWILVQSMNRAFPEPLVVSSKGGPGGGGSRLSARGHQVLVAYQEVTRTLQQPLPELVQTLDEASR